MSKEIKLSKNPLPPDLTEIESSLAQMPLPASSVDRDELLYRAGWAAAEETLSHPQPRVSHWLWPATTAALAATVLVLLFPLGTERVNIEEAKQVVVKQLATTQPATVVHSDAPPLTSKATAESRFVPRFDSRLSVLALRHRTMLRDIGMVSREVVLGDTVPEDIAFDDTPSPPIKTTRELLYELLPELQKSIDENAQQKNDRWTWPKQLWEALS